MTTVGENDPEKDLVTKKSNWLGRFLCKHGFHSWKFLWMRDKRMINVYQFSDWICTLAESCRRPHCRIRRVRENVKVPKRVKT